MSNVIQPPWPPLPQQAVEDQPGYQRNMLSQRCIDAETQLIAKAMQSHLEPADLDFRPKVISIDPADFVEQLLGSILRAINAIRAEGHFATVVAVQQRLAAEDIALAEMGGAAFLARVQDAGLYLIGPEAAFVAAWRRARDHLELWDVAASIHSELGAGETASAGEIIDSWAPRFAQIKASQTQRPQTLKSLAKRISIRCGVEQRQNVYSSGLPALDKALGGEGFIGGLLYGFQARKKVGKTLWMGTSTLNLANSGVPTCYYCFEMGEERISERMIAAHYGGTMNSMALLKGRSAGLAREVSAYSDQYAPDNLFFIDSARPQLPWLQSTAEEMHRRHGVRVHVFDYLQLIKGSDRRASRVDQLDEVADWMAEFAKQTNDVVITGAQENRNGETRYGDSLVMAAGYVFRIHMRDVDIGGHQEKQYWLECTDSRFTAGENAGGEDDWPFFLNATGPRVSQLGHDDLTVIPRGNTSRLVYD